MRKMKKDTKKNVLRVFILILALIMLLGIIVMPLAGSASAEESEGTVTVSSFETGKLSEAIDKAKDGTDLNNVTRIAVSGGTMNAADYNALCGYPNTEYIELAGADTENGVIPENALPSRNQLVYVSLPGNTVTIGAGALSGNRNLLKISMPATVRNIGDRAFEGCEKVEEFTLPAELETLGSGAFSDCKALSAFALPQAITVIPDNCFAKASLTELHLGPQVTAIGNGAFSDCHSLTDIYYYGDTPFSADQSAFQNLKVTIHVYSDLKGFDDLENNFVTVAYDMSGDSEYIPPKSASQSAETGENASPEEPENVTEGVEETAAAPDGNAGKADEETVSSAADGTAVPAAARTQPASGFSTVSVIVIAVLCVIVGVLAALVVVGRKKN